MVRPSACVDIRHRTQCERGLSRRMSMQDTAASNYMQLSHVSTHLSTLAAVIKMCTKVDTQVNQINQQVTDIQSTTHYKASENERMRTKY